MMRRYKTKIDRVKVERFMDEIFPKVKSDLENRLPKLDRISPELIKNDRPPSFALRFIFDLDESCVNLDLATENSGPQIKDNLPEIAQIVGEISEENSLLVWQNRGRDYYDSQGPSGGFVSYKLKPNYQKFRK